MSGTPRTVGLDGGTARADSVFALSGVRVICGGVTYGKGDLSNYEISGMSEAWAFTQALRGAGKNPTRDGIVKAVERFGDDGPGLGASSC